MLYETFNMPPGAPGNSFFTKCLIHVNAVSRCRIDELRSLDGIIPSFLTSESHMYSTCLSLWLDSSSRVKSYGQLMSIYNVINRSKKFFFDITTSRCAKRGICDGVCERRKMVQNYQKCQSVLVFSAWLESLNQVSENDRTTFDKLQNVLFHVIKSDFSYDVRVRQGSRLPSNPQILRDIIDDSRMRRVCARFHWYLPPIITGLSSR